MMVRRASGFPGAFCVADARLSSDGPRAVVFDIGRVLFDWNLRYLFAKLIADEGELDWFLANVVTEQWHFQADEGRPLAEIMADLLSRHPGHAPLIEAYAARFPETLPHAMPGTHDLVRRLAAAGVPLFALTNFGAEFWGMFRPQQPIFDHFGDVVVSGVEQVAKPDPRIYAIAERRFGHPPEALFFIDDNAANVAAARARGWHAHHFSDSAALEAELASLGLLR